VAGGPQPPPLLLHQLEAAGRRYLTSRREIPATPRHSMRSVPKTRAPTNDEAYRRPPFQDGAAPEAETVVMGMLSSPGRRSKLANPFYDEAVQRASCRHARITIKDPPGPSCQTTTDVLPSHGPWVTPEAA